MIYTTPFVMSLMRADPLRGHVEGSWALEINTFLSPMKWQRAVRRVPLGAQKKSDLFVKSPPTDQSKSGSTTLKLCDDNKLRFPRRKIIKKKKEVSCHKNEISSFSVSSPPGAEILNKLRNPPTGKGSPQLTAQSLYFGLLNCSLSILI
jgi:hypothetical protein